MGRNWDWSRQRGKEKRLEAERNAVRNGVPVPSEPPLHSHDATMQSMFSRGWNSVTPCDIHRHLGRAPAVPKQGDPISKLRSLRKCHLQR